jgi:CubicO group peptidase (beta-lactamase class C family)
MNKMFTKIAIGQLVEKGKLSLDDKLGKFLPDYPNAEAREKVTVRHLVNMSSGIGDFFGPKFRNTPKDSIRHNHDYLKFFAAEPLAFEPGTKEMYSNGGYVVLGEIISASSGMDYYDYVRKNIFEVAGMKYSDWFEADAVVQNVAEGYTKQIEDEEAQGQEKQTLKGQANEAAQQQEKKPAKKHWRKNIYTRPARGSAAGGGYATAEDLLRFGRALYECRLVGETWTNWVFTNEEPGSTKIDRSRWSLGIAGGAPGINAMLELDGQTGYTVIVLANYDPPVARDIARMAGRYLQAVKR